MNQTISGKAAELFEKLPWPDTQDEEWRRTDLSRQLPKGLLDNYAALPTAVTEDSEERPAPLLKENCAARVITEKGIPVAMSLSEDAVRKGLTVEWIPGNSSMEELSAGLKEACLDELGQGANRITAWHWRSFPGTLSIHLPENVSLEEPLLIEESLIAGDENSPLLSVPHLHIELPRGAEISLLWSFEGAPEVHDSFIPVVNAGLSADLGENSRLNISLNQNLGKRAVFFLHDRLIQRRDSRLVFTEAHSGGGLVKTRGRVLLSGRGAEARMKGLFLSDKGSHMDIGTIQDHRSPGASSTALYKGAVRPGGRTIFHGLIEVAPGAEGSDAYLTNRNLILGEGARADSIPQLNILTDDVRCSHGSATGKIDPAHLFYLESRGYSPTEAKREIVRGFLSEVLDDVPDCLSEVFTAGLDSKL